jgi:hypothetical protein
MDKSEAILERILGLLECFTQQGMPLPAQLCSKKELQVMIVLSGFLANPNLVASMLPEDMVEAAIHYASLIDEKMAMTQAPESKIHALERLMRLE